MNRIARVVRGERGFPVRVAVSTLAIIALSGCSAGLRATPETGDPSVLTTAAGPIKGVLGKGFREFLGVPYAAPPVGPLRWLPPQPVEPWAGVYDAGSLRGRCPQLSWTMPRIEMGNENCLYLNVYTPRAAHDEAPLPVMVWFHGGAMIAGSAQEIDGSVFASRGNVIVVTVNYRLGALGFFAAPELDAGNPYQTSGNQGMRDQQAALRWVQTNIKVFGGDPARVTIAGQSAGATSNWFHLVSPASAGLFHQIIAESWPPLFKFFTGAPFARDAAGTTSLQEEEQHGSSSRLFAGLGCQAAPDKLACARSKSAHEVLTALSASETGTAKWGVTYDGVVLPDSIPKLIEQGQHVGVPVLTGFNKGDGAFMLLMSLEAGGRLATAEEYLAGVRKMPHGERILVEYPLASYDSPQDAGTAISDDVNACSALVTASTMSAGAPFYLYQFSDPNPPPTIWVVRPPANVHTYAFHTAEIPYVFQTNYPNDLRPGAPAFDPAQQKLSDRMLGYWANFVRTGRPTSNDTWPRYGTSPSVFVLTPAGDEAVRNATYRADHRCAFWETLGAEH